MMTIAQQNFILPNDFADHLAFSLMLINNQGTILYRNALADEILSQVNHDVTKITDFSIYFDANDLLNALNWLEQHPDAAYQFEMDFKSQRANHTYHCTLHKYANHSNLLMFSMMPVPSYYEQYRTLKNDFKALTDFVRLNAMREISNRFADKINQPLTSILAYTQAMKRIYQVDPLANDIPDAMERVVVSAENAGQIIRKIRSEFGSKPIDCQLVDIICLLNECIHLTENEINNHNYQIITEFHTQSAEILIDDIQIKLVIISLIYNAIEALENINALNPQIIIKTQVKDSFFIIHLAVDGAELSSDVQDKMLELIITDKVNRIGIDLSMCQHIIELHNGCINIITGDRAKLSSEDGLVTIQLPMHL